jgi:hypothetical protein
MVAADPDNGDPLQDLDRGLADRRELTYLGPASPE